jgi:protein TonB
MQLAQPITNPRAFPAVLTVVLHIVLVYVIATGLGVIPKPSPPPDSLKLIDLPRPVTREKPQEEEHISTRPRKIAEQPPPKDPVIAEKQDPPRPPPRDDQDETGPTHAGGVVLPEPQLFEPHLARSFEPPYPRPSILQKEEGIVRVRVTISPYGQVGDAIIERSSGFPRLDDAALKAVRRWLFSPARRGEQAIVGSTVVAVRFQLR